MEAVGGSENRVLMIFVDGLGWPDGELGHSVYAPFPALMRLFCQDAVPIDATLGVDGLPQSATGQTTLMTGCNAARRCGRHVEGFPTQALREIIEKENLFKRFMSAGRKVVFANAYLRFPTASMPLFYRSVTTVAILSSLGTVLGREELLAGRAVNHDLTRETTGKHGVLDVPIISEETAADHLLGIAETSGFTLFEYFLTDRVGHRGTHEEVMTVLGSLNRFLQRLFDAAPETLTMIIVSDHGNVESPETRRHTANLIPWGVIGANAETGRQGMVSLEQVFEKTMVLGGIQ
jgi:2,3-bisphosphoglycerate-independent phosphoglycerate mutase